jgi:hypothetical protein
MSSYPQRVLGYIVGTTNTRAYEAELCEGWWPSLPERYPISETTVPHTSLLPGDVRVYNQFVQSDTWRITLAQMHIGCTAFGLGGKKLIQKAIFHIKEKDGLDGKGDQAVFLGIDTINDTARRFYKHCWV